MGRGRGDGDWLKLESNATFKSNTRLQTPTHLFVTVIPQTPDVGTLSSLLPPPCPHSQKHCPLQSGRFGFCAVRVVLRQRELGECI